MMTTPNGISIRKSPYSVKETIDRLQAALESNHATIHARIDQQEELKKAGQEISPLEFLLFGNPKAGGPVIAENPMAALDLPLKVIAWEDKAQTVYIAYHDAHFIKNKYGLSADVSAALNLEPVINKILS